LVAVFISPFTPIATILATVGILYLSLPVFRFAWLNTKAGYVINFFTVESILIVGLALTGQLIYAAIMSILLTLKYKLIVHT